MPVMPPSGRLVGLREFQLTRAGRRMLKIVHQAELAPSPAGKLHCPKCDGTMKLARLVRTPSGVDIRTFECSSCDHAQIVTVGPDLPTETRDLNDIAADALEAARRTPRRATYRQGLLSLRDAVCGSDNPLKP
jgi:hypothetical protein